MKHLPSLHVQQFVKERSDLICFLVLEAMNYIPEVHD